MPTLAWHRGPILHAGPTASEGDGALEPGGSAQVIRRRAARILLIDPGDRILLLAARDPADGRVVWFLPGGGIEPGESIEQAARRELLEEVGVGEPVTLAGPVWTRHHDFSWNGRHIIQDEWFFELRLDGELDASTIHPAGAEAAVFEGACWAGLAELAEWAEIVAPRRLCELLRPVLAGQLPAEPIDAGV
ncbi:MAG TPA: NUDIX domain-containing protein [Candidatus Limnocylindria bacterium]|nr:NUDIX domain-containing protein [Candidatus Limnocylindria bacterium]